MSGKEAFARDSFTWLLGIEDTCVYPIDESLDPLDEHQLTGHSANWREDLTLLKNVGASAVRYGVSWPTVHIDVDTFDWTVLDEIVPFAVGELGLTIVADLVHYGTPRWLIGSFADARYPDAIANFAGAFAARYKDQVTHFTPLNEPVTTASFCGLRGVWPPALTGWEGWVSVAVPIAIGMVKSIRAIRSAQPSAVIVHVEAATLVGTDEQALLEHAELLAYIGWLPTDLILGKVTPQHRMWWWLLEHGANDGDLLWLAEQSVHLDMIGVNYYPDLTPRRLETVQANTVQVSFDRGFEGLKETVRAFSARYRLPLLITETSIEGTDAAREAWLRESVEATRQLIAEGIDLRGYTWWPLFDFVDWSWAAAGSNVEEFAIVQTLADGTTVVGPAPPLGDPADGKSAFLRRMGLVRLDEQVDGNLKRVTTPAALAFRELSEGSAT